MNKNKIYLKDIDGTFFRHSLHLKLMEALIKSNIFPEIAEKRFYDAMKKWKDRAQHDSFENFTSESIKLVYEYLVGKNANHVMVIARQLIDEIFRETYLFPRWLQREAEKSGYKIGAISQSPNFMVEYFSLKHGLAFCSGSPYPVDKAGLFTSEMYAIPKDKTIEKIRQQEVYDFSESIGIGDTQSDVPIFEAVSYPICFNPSKALAKEAESRGWPMIIERKNNIVILKEGRYKLFEEKEMHLHRFLEENFRS